MTKKLTSLDIDDLDYARTRIAMYGEMPSKEQLLKFLDEVEMSCGPCSLCDPDDEEDYA